MAASTSFSLREGRVAITPYGSQWVASKIARCRVSPHIGWVSSRPAILARARAAPPSYIADAAYAGVPKFGFKPKLKGHVYREGHAVIDFCPDGYVPVPEGIDKAAICWFPEQMAALERAAGSQSETKADNSIDAAVRAFCQLQVPHALQLEFQDIANQTVHRLRNSLHQGKLNAYYFEHDGRHCVSRDFWVTGQANGVLESGIYWPFGKPPRFWESRPNYRLLLLQSELDALLSEQPTKKPLPRTKMPDLVAALRRLDDLPNREKQRAAARELPEFEQYHLTDDVFREAEKQVPRKPGRKPRRPEQ
jgi:hypothetical protein